MLVVHYQSRGPFFVFVFFFFEFFLFDISLLIENVTLLTPVYNRT